MKRRQFIGTLGGAVVWPFAVQAQQAQRARRVIVLFGLSEADPETKRRTDVLVEGLRELGWTEGRNIQFDFRYNVDPASAHNIAAQAVELAPDLIVAHSNPFVAALRPIHRDIPVVFAGVSDPVSSGFVESLARPGGNITGFSNFEPEIGGKWVQALKEIVPELDRALFLHHGATAANVAFLRTAEATAKGLGVAVAAADARDGDDIVRAVTTFAQKPGGGLIIAAHALFNTHIDLIGTLAARYRLPAIYPFRQWIVRNEGLMSYGIDLIDQFRRVAVYVDRILRGAKAGELPVQNPTRYELVINLKAAKALGLEVPQPMLARADETIE